MFSRGPSGGVIQHDKKGRRNRTYGDPAVKPRPEVLARMKRATLPIKVAGAVLRRINKFLYKRGVRGVVANASFSDDGYHLHVSLLRKDQDMKTAMFAEAPEGQYKVWP